MEKTATSIPMDAQINTVKDVKRFFHHIIAERKTNFHPDDPFEEYIDKRTGAPLLSPEECTLYNRLLNESFTVCEKEGADIYRIGLDELTKDILKHRTT